MESSQTRKLIVAGVLLALAVALYVTLSLAEDDVPDAATAGTTWYCTACEKLFDLSAADAATAVETRVLAGQSEDEPEGIPTARGRGKQTFVKVAKCPTCSEWTGVETAACRGCQTVFGLRTAAGKTVACPKCRLDPVTGETAEGE